MSQPNGGQSPTVTPEFRADLKRVMQHQSARRYEKAGALIDDMLASFGALPVLTHYKGANQILRGDTEGGLSLVREAVSQTPDDPVLVCDLGAQLANLGRLDEAIEQFQYAADIAPNYGIARGNLGASQVIKREYDKAIENLERAVELQPRLFDAHFNLGTAYLRTNQPDKAVDIFFKALAIDPLSAGCHSSLSTALYQRERYDSSEYHARRAIELEPDAGEPYLNLGNALSSSGKVDEAVEALRVAAQRPPVQLFALGRLIHLRKVQKNSADMDLLEAALDQSDQMGEENKCSLFYTAGKAFDDLADYKKAFQFFRQANEIAKKLYPFDATAYRERSERLRSFATPALITRCQGAGIDDVTPIFICGMPRSGTTLMEQMLSRHPDVQAGGEMSAALTALNRNTRLRDALGGELPDHKIVADDLNRLGEDYVAAVRHEGIRAKIFTDKLPGNYRHIGLLALALPKARFVIMRRHPLDCLLSNYFQSFGQNQPFSSAFENLAAYFAEFHRDVEHAQGLYPERVRQVQYEDIVHVTEQTLRAAIEFAGLEWTADVLDHSASTHQVNTASIGQVREPIYTRAVARWKNYREEIAPLQQELERLVPGLAI